MSTLSCRPGRLAYRRCRLVIAARVPIPLLAVGAAVTPLRFFAARNTIPGTESQRSLDVPQARFPTADGAQGRIVFRAAGSPARTPAARIRRCGSAMSWERANTC
ncbi:hypothetical protein [Embleya scabrispora]|uniref:hypothetical protein n=1 Tax=Embleya scabrispora TaxID=159449 RepID=UPI001319CDD9|nr:hypothetical protein [Embleya scabrispora]MYS87868.1 hypothetical protein [Streptomyces sp. SID5474]